MSENKRYYWLKLNENFFEDDTIAWLEEQKNGKDYVIFYLKLCLKSLKDDGSLIRYVGQTLIPYDVPALAKLTNTNEDTVAVAMKTFAEIGLVDLKETGEIYLSQINELIGSETDSAKRMRKIRAKENNQKKLPASQCDNNVQKSDRVVQKSDTELEIEIEKDIDIDKDKEEEDTPPASKKNQKHKYGANNNVLLTDEEHKKLADKFGDTLNSRIDDLSFYIGSTGKKYKSHYLTILSWARKDEEKEQPKQKASSMPYADEYLKQFDWWEG